jgi:hypothetical protein
MNKQRVSADEATRIGNTLGINVISHVNCVHGEFFCGYWH